MAAAVQSDDDEFGFDFLGRAKDFWRFLTELQQPAAFVRRTRYAQLQSNMWLARLLLFLQLQVKQPAAADPLLPPQDVALMWAALLIRRPVFLQTLERLGVGDAELLAALPWSAPLPAQLPPEGKQRDQLVHRSDTAQRLWREAYPGVTYACLDSSELEQLAGLVKLCDWFPRCRGLGLPQLLSDVDWWQLLVDEHADVLADPDAFFARSRLRYRDWLRQFCTTKAAPGTDGPQLDIDLWWHVHQMAPQHYIKYCHANGGFVNWHVPKSDAQHDAGPIIDVCRDDGKRYTCCCA